MKHLSPAQGVSNGLDFIFRRVFGLDLRRGGVLGASEESDYNTGMPKVDAANRIKEFLLGNDFQTEFDKWATEVEKEHGGKLEMTHEEIVHQGTRLLVWWRIAPRAHVGTPRRR